MFWHMWSFKFCYTSRKSGYMFKKTWFSCVEAMKGEWSPRRPQWCAGSERGPVVVECGGLTIVNHCTQLQKINDAMEADCTRNIHPSKWCWRWRSTRGRPCEISCRWTWPRLSRIDVVSFGTRQQYAGSITPATKLNTHFQTPFSSSFFTISALVWASGQKL